MDMTPRLWVFVGRKRTRREIIEYHRSVGNTTVPCVLIMHQPFNKEDGTPWFDHGDGKFYTFKDGEWKPLFEPFNSYMLRHLPFHRPSAKPTP